MSMSIKEAVQAHQKQIEDLTAVVLNQQNVIKRLTRDLEETNRYLDDRFYKGGALVQSKDSPHLTLKDEEWRRLADP
jgi:hypothetical protein